MDAVYRKLKDVLVEVLANGTTADGIADDADLVDEYGLDSLQMISFLLGVEDAFDVELDYESLDLDHLRSVRQFGDWVAELDGAVVA
ncbi:acyl carrier protein [Saccharothrix yanglingensis]|uniref:Acyl carrier protein n=1 Tax=Saccharothrix yanglingensis TaxID=659496 RepID=A0ABU0X3U7_9PSEU|nr:phosphopantetheine-binding protein [Saccharothrix yanglingensis]MDQ2586686.1 acyl carrier protein [Saccharothrix yanglingensis]